MKQVAIAAILFAFGCTATETGNPTFEPTTTLSGDTLSGMALPDDPMLPSEPMVGIRGEPGFVSPPVGAVWVWNLERDVPPAATDVADDGSFSITVVAAVGERLRLHVVDEAGRLASEPIDLTATESSLELEVMTSGCARPLEPVAVIGGDGTAAIELVNFCDMAVTVGPARFQSTASAYGVDDDVREIAPGDSTTLGVRAPAEAGPVVVLIPVSGGDTGERAVSISR